MHVPLRFKYYLISGICLTTDLDFYAHMNNSRYLREADFGRCELWLCNGIYRKAQQLKCRIVLGGVTIRYRRSLQLFERYRLCTSVSTPKFLSHNFPKRFIHSKVALLGRGGGERGGEAAGERGINYT